MTNPIVCLLVPCAGNVSHGGKHCRLSFSFPFHSTPDDMQAALDRRGWVMTVISPVTTQPVILSALCPDCAKSVIDPQLMDEFQKVRRS